MVHFDYANCLNESVDLIKGSFAVLEFNTPSGIVSPILRSDSGFVGKGLTQGEAREFVVPNQAVPANAKVRIVE